ncbi:MAG: hypothetical protein PUE22_04790 [Roseburia porci]|nr:hypothetical protein [Roseburia porci]
MKLSETVKNRSLRRRFEKDIVQGRSLVFRTIQCDILPASGKSIIYL